MIEPAARIRLGRTALNISRLGFGSAPLGGLLRETSDQDAAAPFDSGILATGAVAGATYDYQPAPAGIVSRVRAIEALCARFRIPLAAAALQFPLRHPAVASVVTGMRSAAEVRQNLALMRMRIPAEFWSNLR